MEYNKGNKNIELEQKAAECCTEEVGTMVQKLVRVMQIFERDQIKPFGFTTSQCYVLVELKKFNNLTMNELSERMNLNTSTMTRIINNLVRDGYIQRLRDEGDRRIVIVKLTEEGIIAAQSLEESIMDYYRKIVSNLPNGQVEDVLKSVELLINAFEKANPNCC
jgi:MarR family transcriptional regulator, organic hydroperoxide resistance regulator